MSRKLLGSVLAGAAAAVAAVAWFVSGLGESLDRPVSENRWIVWLGAPALAAAVTLLGLTGAAVWRLMRPATAAGRLGLPGRVGVVAAVAVVLGAAWVGSAFVPERMARAAALAIEADPTVKHQLGQPLGRRPYSYEDARAELERLDRVGAAWAAVMFGTPQAEGVALVPLLRGYGLVPYSEQVDGNLQVHGWTPVPATPGRLAVVVTDPDQEKVLKYLGDKVRQRAAELTQLHEATKPGKVEFVGRWVKAYSAQADAIHVHLLTKTVFEMPQAVKDLVLLVKELSDPLNELDQLRESDWQDRTAAWKKVTAALRERSLPAWRNAPKALAAALDALDRPEESLVTGAQIETLAALVPAYAHTAKQADWWKDQGLKEALTAMRQRMSGDNWPAKVAAKKDLASATTALARLRSALDTALVADTVPDAPPQVVQRKDRPRWDANAVLLFVESRLGIDQWPNLPIKLNGKDVGLVDAIRQDWKNDFLVPPPVVSPDRHSEDEAIRHALRLVVRHLKPYADRLADEWQARVNRVEEAKKGPALWLGGYPEPVRRPLRALFTEDAYWHSQRDALKARLADLGFDARHVDTGSGEEAGRVKVAVEENALMAGKLIGLFGSVSDLAKDADSSVLQKGAGWYYIFYAGNEPGSHLDPFSVMLRIRSGLPKDMPRNADGTVVKTPDGRIDWSKAQGPVIGLTELGGANFQALLNAPPALPEDPAPVVPQTAKPGGPKQSRPDE